MFGVFVVFFGITNFPHHKAMLKRHEERVLASHILLLPSDLAMLVAQYALERDSLGLVACLFEGLKEPFCVCLEGCDLQIRRRACHRPRRRVAQPFEVVMIGTRLPYHFRANVDASHIWDLLNGDTRTWLGAELDRHGDFAAIQREANVLLMPLLPQAGPSVVETQGGGQWQRSILEHRSQLLVRNRYTRS
jgi:hypothetical protein